MGDMLTRSGTFNNSQNKSFFAFILKWNNVTLFFQSLQNQNNINNCIYHLHRSIKYSLIFVNTIMKVFLMDIHTNNGIYSLPQFISNFSIAKCIIHETFDTNFIKMQCKFYPEKWSVLVSVLQPEELVIVLSFILFHERSSFV